MRDVKLCDLFVSQIIVLRKMTLYSKHQGKYVVLYQEGSNVIQLFLAKVNKCMTFMDRLRV